MKKYKLINTKNKEEHLCDKVTIDGFDYYVSDSPKKISDFVHLDNTIKELPDYNGNYIVQLLDETLLNSANVLNSKKVIATNNPNTNIPKVVDEIERLTFQEFKDWSFGEHGPWHTYKMFQKGYSKSQETHPNSDDDMIDFIEWVIYNYPNQWKSVRTLNTKGFYSTKELFQLWKKQQTKIVYYE